MYLAQLPSYGNLADIARTSTSVLYRQYKNIAATRCSLRQFGRPDTQNVIFQGTTNGSAQERSVPALVSNREKSLAMFSTGKQD